MVWCRASCSTLVHFSRSHQPARGLHQRHVCGLQRHPKSLQLVVHRRTWVCVSLWRRVRSVRPRSGARALRWPASSAALQHPLRTCRQASSPVPVAGNGAAQGSTHQLSRSLQHLWISRGPPSFRTCPATSQRRRAQIFAWPSWSSAPDPTVGRAGQRLWPSVALRSGRLRRASSLLEVPWNLFALRDRQLLDQRGANFFEWDTLQHACLGERSTATCSWALPPTCGVPQQKWCESTTHIWWRQLEIGGTDCASDRPGYVLRPWPQARSLSWLRCWLPGLNDPTCANPFLRVGPRRVLEERSLLRGACLPLAGKGIVAHRRSQG